MPLESEKIKKLVDFKKKVERRVEELKSQIEEKQAILDVIESVLVEKGFQRADVTEEKAETEVSPKTESPSSSPRPSPEGQKTIPLKTESGEPLANLHVERNSVRIVPVEDKIFNTNTPPFTQFLVERVLEEMEKKDNKLVREGRIAAEEAFSYHIGQEGENIRELVIQNVNDKRLKELKSTARWTLEKMYEKTGGLA